MKREKFYLKTSAVIQGDFKLKDLNLLLVFQVNCASCFSSAFPLMNRLEEQFRSSGLKLLALSTAFEDFDLNTLENTERLIKKGELVGETKKFLSQNGYDRLPYTIKCSVAFDSLGPMTITNLDEKVEGMCQILPDFPKYNYLEKKLIREQMREYLTNKKYSAVTFDSNNLQGTPSWILFDKSFNVYGKWFGQKDDKEFEIIISQILGGKISH